MKYTHSAKSAFASFNVLLLGIFVAITCCTSNSSDIDKIEQKLRLKTKEYTEAYFEYLEAISPDSIQFIKPTFFNPFSGEIGYGPIPAGFRDDSIVSHYPPLLSMMGKKSTANLTLVVRVACALLVDGGCEPGDVQLEYKLRFIPRAGFTTAQYSTAVCIFKTQCEYADPDPVIGDQPYEVLYFNTPNLDWDEFFDGGIYEMDHEVTFGNLYEGSYKLEITDSRENFQLSKDLSFSEGERKVLHLCIEANEFMESTDFNDPLCRTNPYLSDENCINSMDFHPDSGDRDMDHDSHELIVSICDYSYDIER